MTALVPCTVCGSWTAVVAGQPPACSWTCATRVLRAAPTVAPAPTGPQNGSPREYGPVLSGAAACPRCGRVRGVVFGTGSHRCYGCWHRWIPTPPTAPAA